MSLDQNKAVVRRFVDEVQNRHNTDAIEEFFSPDIADHSGMAAKQGIEGIREFFVSVFAAFPDIRFTIHDQVAEGDKVVTRKTFRATHQGDFLGLSATGKSVEVEVIDIFRVSEGKLVEHWALADQHGMLQQMGVVPPPA